MTNTVAETLIGAAVVAVAAGFVVYAAQSSGRQVGGDSYTLSAAFRSWKTGLANWRSSWKRRVANLRDRRRWYGSPSGAWDWRCRLSRPRPQR
jgi:hypothetical protein